MYHQCLVETMPYAATNLLGFLRSLNFLITLVAHNLYYFPSQSLPSILTLGFLFYYVPSEIVFYYETKKFYFPLLKIANKTFILSNSFNISWFVFVSN